MKIVFSRKGFDTGAGGVPSPILEDRPISLPIPTRHRSKTTFGDLGYGEIVETLTNGRLSADSLCHNDPMFEDGRCAFGQTGAAQSHLANNGVGVGDVFLFFGLFAGPKGQDRHHRFFGYLRVEKVKLLGSSPAERDQPSGFSMRHPHTIGEWNANNTLYVGRGQKAAAVDDRLRLSHHGGPVSRWRVPEWLRDAGLTYHGRIDRWEGTQTLNVVARGQEFVSDVSDRPEAHGWLEGMLAVINETTEAGRQFDG